MGEDYCAGDDRKRNVKMEGYGMGGWVGREGRRWKAMEGGWGGVGGSGEGVCAIVC